MDLRSSWAREEKRVKSRREEEGRGLTNLVTAFIPPLLHMPARPVVLWATEQWGVPTNRMVERGDDGC